MSSLCLKCHYPVTEPVCASCIVDEIKVWLYEYNIEKEVIKKINKEFRFLLNYVKSINYVLLPASNLWKIMKCIKCKNEMHRMCFYCVINQASQIVDNNINNQNILEDFNETFNKTQILS